MLFQLFSLIRFFYFIIIFFFLQPDPRQLHVQFSQRPVSEECRKSVETTLVRELTPKRHARKREGQGVESIYFKLYETLEKKSSVRADSNHRLMVLRKQVRSYQDTVRRAVRAPERPHDYFIFCESVLQRDIYLYTRRRRVRSEVM